jgi:hypothetical protein
LLAVGVPTRGLRSLPLCMLDSLDLEN